MRNPLKVVWSILQNILLVTIGFNIMCLQNISYRIMKYIRPIWYFHLKPNVGGDVWGSYDSLSSKQKKIIQYDKNYSNEMISCWDASFQALMKGIIVDERIYSNQEIGKLKAIDLYRFLRKYYKSFYRKWWMY